MLLRLSVFWILLGLVRENLRQVILNRIKKYFISLFQLECLTGPHNQFDQLCINYINERMQQFFVQRMIIEESSWYEREGVNVPSIPFFDNGQILGMFEEYLIDIQIN